MKLMLDTNAFDFIYDNQIDLNELAEKGEFYTSNVQRSELMNIPNDTSRQKLLAIYESLNPKNLIRKVEFG